MVLGTPRAHHKCFNEVSRALWVFCTVWGCSLGFNVLHKLLEHCFRFGSVKISCLDKILKILFNHLVQHSYSPYWWAIKLCKFTVLTWIHVKWHKSSKITSLNRNHLTVFQRRTYLHHDIPYSIFVHTYSIMNLSCSSLASLGLPLLFTVYFIW